MCSCFTGLWWKRQSNVVRYVPIYPKPTAAVTAMGEHIETWGWILWLILSLLKWTRTNEVLLSLPDTQSFLEGLEHLYHQFLSYKLHQRLDFSLWLWLQLGSLNPCVDSKKKNPKKPFSFNTVSYYIKNVNTLSFWYRDTLWHISRYVSYLFFFFNNH